MDVNKSGRRRGRRACGGRGAGAASAAIGRHSPAPRGEKTSGKKRERASVPHGRRGRTHALQETARPPTGGRGRAMPALALRDQPLDCSMRLRDVPAWPPPPRHGQCPQCSAAPARSRPSTALHRPSRPSPVR
ncbi:unnamed protein product [Colias eurytheme]|nr:unnamed protein product [Colias eurytheme]